MLGVVPMTYDHELYLIGYETGENEYGDPVKVPVRRRVLCGRRSVTRSEHYQAAAVGLRPEIVLVINRHEYQGETELEFEGKRYRIERTYAAERARDVADFEELELVCVGLVGQGG